jgi:hypothetical protein
MGFSQLYFSISLSHLAPRGEFKQNIKNNFGGINLNVGQTLKTNPNIEVGAFVGAGMYAYKEYTTTITTAAGTKKEVEVYEDDCYMQFGIQANYTFLKKTAFQPYAGVSIAGNQFFSHTDPMNNEPEYKKQFVCHGVALSTGLNLGFKLNLNKLFSDNGKNGGAYIAFEKSFVHGSKTTYRYFEQDPEVLNGNLNLGLLNSRTSYTGTTLKIGFSF